MSEIGVKDLPNEIIIKILRYVDQKNLRDATLTCKQWRDLIESSIKWSLKCRSCSIDNPTGEPWSNLMATNRKFGTINLKELVQSSEMETLVETFQIHGLNVTNLYLRHSNIDSSIYFVKFLKCLPNLKNVFIKTTGTIDGWDMPAVHDLPELKYLKTLTMIGSNYAITKFFRKAKLKTMKALESKRSLEWDWEPLEDFLKSQEMLTALAIRSIPSHSTSVLSNAMALQLTQLSLNNIERLRFPNDHTNMLKFLETQAKTLKALLLGYNVPMSIFEFVFANMTQLETLTLNIGEMSRHHLHDRLEENRSITNLALLNFRMPSDYDFFKKLPNIRSLKLPTYCNNEMILAAAQNFNKLDSLTTSVPYGIDFDGVQISTLKTLEIDGLFGKIDWNKLTKGLPQLNELTINLIRDESYLTSDDIYQITTNVSLRSLILGNFFVADTRFFEIIRNKCSDLKVLDLHHTCVSDELKDNIDCNVLRLRDEIRCSEYFMI